MNNEKIIEQIGHFKRRQIIFVIITCVINCLLITGVCIYFNLKQQALIGSVYINNNSEAADILKNLFYLKVNNSNITEGHNAVSGMGYGSNGWMYLMHVSGEIKIYIIIVLIIAAMCITAVIYCDRIINRGVLKQISDIVSDNTRLNKCLENERDYNKDRQKKLYDFIENIAHQIKTPLAAITVKLELMEEICEEKSIKKLTGECISNTFRIRDFIKRLLDISRLEEKKVIMADDKTEIGLVIEQSIEKVSGDTDRIQVNNECTDNVLYADESWLIESFINIISNCLESVKAKADGHVYIHIVNNDSQFIITISDNGRGISIDEFNTIFDRFVTNGSGDRFNTGIGLNLSKLIIEAHHGTIKAGNSTRYGGAEFKIMLPVYSLKKR